MIKGKDGIARFARVGTTKGVSDITFLWRGIFFAAEIKAGRDALTADQREFLQRIQKAGGVAIIVRDVGDVIRVINKLQNEPPRVLPAAVHLDLEKCR